MNEKSEIDPRDQRAIRVSKMKKLRADGIDPYPARIGEGRITVSKVRENWDELKRIEREDHTIEREGVAVRLAGRITSIRSHGKSMFVTITDGTGDFQLYLRKNTLEEATPNDSNIYERAKELDIGDFIVSAGELFTTRTGEPTQLVKEWAIICKALLPLPEKWHGLNDPDLRLRQRYLDLLTNPEVRLNFEKRALIIKSIRNFLENRGYIELETPVLTSLYGGAAARPFMTHHNALDIDLFLRIATELYLKRLIVGGFEKIYEMGKVFRNEGVDRDHNPEFTLLELYEAYTDYNGMMELAESMIINAARAVADYTGYKTPEEEVYTPDNDSNGIIVNYEETKIHISPPFKRVAFVDIVEDITGIDILSENRNEVLEYLESRSIEIDPKTPYWNLIDKLFSESVEPSLIDPTFVLDYPVGLSPLAKRSPNNSKLTERFELFIAGKEIANAFSELNDPIDQRERMEAQVECHKEGDSEAPHALDMDFITALEHGMPPTGGMGIGVGRLVTILCGAHALKEIIPFPLLKPKDQ